MSPSDPPVAAPTPHNATTEIGEPHSAAVPDAGAPQEGAEHEQRCGGTGMVAYWDGSAYAGEMCRGCIDCERHDSECEAELTSHGYTPCRCDERAKSRVAAPTPETPSPERLALLKLFEAYRELKRLGWSDVIYCPKDGTHFDAIEVGSTGIHDCNYDGTWPKGCWWIYDGDMGPAHPVLFRLKPLAAAVSHPQPEVKEQ